MSNLYPRRLRSSSARRRQLFAVLTAAFILVQSVAFVAAPAANAQVKRGVVKWAPAPPAPLVPSTSIVISQVYGGAGCGTAGCSTFKNDYIELFNRGASAQSVNGWSVQYSAATSATWAVTNLTNVTLQPGQYYLIAEGAGSNGVNNLPTPDATGNTAMSATAGKVALVNTTTALTGTCPTITSIVDIVRYGTSTTCPEIARAPAPSTTTAAVRKNGGCTDTGNNSADFSTLAPNPRNTAAPVNTCAASSLPISDGALLDILRLKFDAAQSWHL